MPYTVEIRVRDSKGNPIYHRQETVEAPQVHTDSWQDEAIPDTIDSIKKHLLFKINEDPNWHKEPVSLPLLHKNFTF